MKHLLLIQLFIALAASPVNTHARDATTTSAAAGDLRTQIQPGNPNLHVRGHLQAFLARCETDKKAHVAFLGGSITQNTGGHTAMIPEWLQWRFPETEFTFTNAGLGSTCSTSGAFRLDSHILKKGPVDLFIVEFAVNDDQDAVHARQQCIRGMEGIIRQVREKSPRTGIVMVHFVNPPMLEKLQRGEIPVSIAAHEAVAAHYGVTSVDVASEIAGATANEKYSWEEYGGTHPKKFGYRIASNMIIAAIEAALSREPDSEATPLASPLDAGSYHRAAFVAPLQAKSSKGWKLGAVGRDLLPEGMIREQYLEYDVLRGDQPGEQLTLEFDGRTVGAFILAGPDAGMVETSIDDGPAHAHDLYHPFSKKLNYPRSVIFASDLEPGPHRLTLEISAEKNPQSTGHAASILFFEVNE